MGDDEGKEGDDEGKKGDDGGDGRLITPFPYRFSASILTCFKLR